MKIEDIHAEIEKDSVIDKANLDTESLNIPILHAKWYRIFMEELRFTKALEHDYKVTKRDRTLYYTGKAPDEEYLNEPMNLKAVLKADVDMYLDGDEKLAKIRLRLELQKAKLEMLETFLKNISTRNFLIKNAIDFQRFKNGA